MQEQPDAGVHAGRRCSRTSWIKPSSLARDAITSNFTDAYVLHCKYTHLGAADQLQRNPRRHPAETGVTTQRTTAASFQ